MSRVQRIAREIVSVTFLKMLGMPLNMIQMAILAKYFGIGHEIAAFFMAQGIFNRTSSLVQLPNFRDVLIPLLTKHKESNNSDAMWRLFWCLCGSMLVITGLFSGIIYFIAPFLTRLFAFGFSPADRLYVSHIVQWMIFAVIFMSGYHLASSILYVHNKVAWVEVAGLAVPSAVIVATLLGARRFGIQATVLGYVLGHALSFLIVLVLSAFLGLRWTSKVFSALPELRLTVRKVAPFYAYSGVVYLRSCATTAIFSFLPIADYAVYQYAVRTFGRLQGLINSPTAMVALPVFSAEAAKDGLSEIYSNKLNWAVNRGVRSIVYLSLFATLCIISLREPIVNVLFRRGAFTAEAVHRTAICIAIVCASLPLEGISQIFTRAFIALTQTRAIAEIAIIIQGLILLMYFVLIRSFGLYGACWATPLISVCSCLLYGWRLTKLLNLSSFLPDRVYCWRLLTISAAVFVTGSFGVQLLQKMESTPTVVFSLSGLCLIGGIMALLYLTGGYLFRLDEAKAVTELFPRMNFSS